MLFLHHLVRECLSVFQGDLQQVLPCGKAFQAEAFKTVCLSVHQAALHVVQLNTCGLHVGRVLQVKLAAGGVGIEGIGADGYRILFGGRQSLVVEEEIEDP